MEKKTLDIIAEKSPISHQPETEHSKPVNNYDSLINIQETIENFGRNIQDIIDALPFYVLMVDSEHYILLANQAVHRELNIEPEQIIGKYCPKVIHGIDRPYHGCPLEEAVDKDTPIEREIYDEKSERWVISAIYPTKMVTHKGKKIYFHMVTDVTHRKADEEQLKFSRDRLRSISSHLESVREEERRRIARDLHDETSQLLASLSAYIETAVGTLPSGETKALAMLQKAQSLSTQIIDQIHRIIYEFHPIALDELGLVFALRSWIENNLEISGVKVKFTTTGKIRRLYSEMETALFRIIQEAINNIAKHADASNAVISIYFRRHSIRVHIQDNGKGFDVEEAMSLKNKPHGFGLWSMKERAGLYNGTFDIHSNSHSGTKIGIIIPLTEEGSHE